MIKSLRHSFVLLIGIAGIAGLAGCKQAEEFGYVQIKREIRPLARDVYLLNGKALREIHENAELVMKQKTGAGKLVLLRNGRTWTLCTFALVKNRVVTATLTSRYGSIRCTVQG